MSNKVMGKGSILRVQPEADVAYTVISGATRSINNDESVDEIDVTVRDSTAKETEDGYPNLTLELSGLRIKESAGGTPALKKLPRGGSGSVQYLPEGVGVDKPMLESTYKVLGGNGTDPYDNALTWTRRLNITADWEETIQV